MDGLKLFLATFLIFILCNYQYCSKYDTPFWEYAKSLPFNPSDRFDTSDSSLYNLDTSKNHQLLFKSVSVAGATTGGSAYTTGVTQSSTTTIPIGTAGSYIQIEVAADAPQLYYYCTNHSGMGNSLLVFTRPDIINGIDER